MHGCTVRQIGLTLGNNPVARLEAGNDLGRILGNQSGSDGNAGCGSAVRIYGEYMPVRMDSVGTEIVLRGGRYRR